MSKTPWTSGFNLPDLFGKAQKEKNNSTRKNNKKNKNATSGKGAGANATLNTSALTSQLASLSLTSSQGKPAAISSTPQVKPLSEEEIMAQAARWEAENNARRAAGKGRWQQKLASLSTNTRSSLNIVKNYQKLALLNRNILERQRLGIKSSPYGEYMSEYYPTAKNPSAFRIVTAEAVAQGTEYQRALNRKDMAKQQANQRYPGLKDKPLVISELTNFQKPLPRSFPQKRKTRKSNRKSTRKNRK